MLPKNAQVQIVLFSATFPDHVRNFANKFAPNANRIELQKNEISVDNIRQFYMDCRDEEHKYEVLVSLYNLLTIGQSIIFCQVRSFPMLLEATHAHVVHSHQSIGIQRTKSHNE